MRKMIHGVPFALLAILVGCVVIPDTFDANINVTIRHIQEQAGDALAFVEGETDKLPSLGADAKASTSWLDRTWDAVSPMTTAYAQELSESSARAQQILVAMRERFPQVESIKKTGAVGENNRGFLELAKPDAVTTAEEKNRVQQIVAAENADRKAYYQEIARINKEQNVTVGAVERVYAQTRLERGNTGELFQLPPAGEDFDAFVKSAKGRALGTQAQPGAWVTLP